MGVRLGGTIIGLDFSDAGDEWSTGCSGKDIGEEGDRMEGSFCTWASWGGTPGDVGAVVSTQMRQPDSTPE